MPRSTLPRVTCHSWKREYITRYSPARIGSLVAGELSATGYSDSVHITVCAFAFKSPKCSMTVAEVVFVVLAESERLYTRLHLMRLDSARNGSYREYVAGVEREPDDRGSIAKREYARFQPIFVVVYRLIVVVTIVIQTEIVGRIGEDAIAVLQVV